MLHMGLLITKDDDEVIEEWLGANCRFFDAIVCLDGSQSERTRHAAKAHPTVLYVHERDVTIEYRTDHGLRSVAHQVILEHFGGGGWVTLCHADEFFYHDPRKCCLHAEHEGCNGIYWYAVHFLPHLKDMALWPAIRHLPIQQRIRYYHWDVGGSGEPWLEFRSYHNNAAIRWEPHRHGSTQPQGCNVIAPFHPAYRHFKVFSLDAECYSNKGTHTEFRNHWQGVADGRTGVPWPVCRAEDLFVERFGVYRRCDYFRGTFAHHWNMGDTYR